MKITITEHEGRLVAALCGDFDTTASNGAEKDLAPLFASSDRDIVIDCRELSYISSSGLRILLNIYKHARSTSHRVALAGIHPESELYEVFHLSGLLQLFDIE